MTEIAILCLMLMARFSFAGEPVDPACAHGEWISVYKMEVEEAPEGVFVASNEAGEEYVMNSSHKPLVFALKAEGARVTLMEGGGRIKDPKAAGGKEHDLRGKTFAMFSFLDEAQNGERPKPNLKAEDPMPKEVPIKIVGVMKAQEIIFRGKLNYFRKKTCD